MAKDSSKNDQLIPATYLTVGAGLVAGVFMTLPLYFKTGCVLIGFLIMLLNAPQLVPAKEKGFKSLIAVIFFLLLLILPALVWRHIQTIQDQCDTLTDFISYSRKLRIDIKQVQNNGKLSDKKKQLFLENKNTFYANVKNYIKNNLKDKNDLVLFSENSDEEKMNDMEDDFDQSWSDLRADELVLQNIVEELKRKE